MKISVVDCNVDVTSCFEATIQILGWAVAGEGRYICAANVHMLMEARDSAAYDKIVNSADLVTPDGMPLVWMMRLKGAEEQQRVYGPDLMLSVLEAAAREHIPVGLYGGTPEVLGLLVDKLKMLYQNLEIAYYFSPPFRELTMDEDVHVVKAIRNSGTRILFVGLGCPRQEIWMSRNCDNLNLVMIGVGAAFDFHAGAKLQAPFWMQRIGLEWLFRLLTEPRRLWRRYFYHNPRFVFFALFDLFNHWRLQKTT